MAKDWPYSIMSRTAKLAGGPEKLAQMMFNKGKLSMIPWLGVAAIGGAAITGVVAHFKSKKTDEKSNEESTDTNEEHFE